MGYHKTMTVKGVEVPRCQEYVYRRDTYRLSRGHGFRMHYDRGQCERRATHGDYCWQHRKGQ